MRAVASGALDRALDVAATLELRGYSLDGPRARNRRNRSRYDRRFYAVAAVVLVTAIAGKLAGADDFHAYPTVTIGIGPATLAVAAVVTLSGLAPLRRGPNRQIHPADGTKRRMRWDKSSRRRRGLGESARRGGVARV